MTIDKLRERMRQRMNETGMSAVNLSTYSGVGYLTVRRFLNGNNDTTGDKLLRMMETLGMNIQKGTTNARQESS